MIDHRTKRFPWVIETLVRDGYSCTMCGSDKNVIVHHKDDSRKTGVLNNSLDNLTCLCKFCHSIVHGITKSKHGKIKKERPPKVVRFDVVEMRESGMSFVEIGNKLGFSRQRAHQIYHLSISRI